jgi:hypothetical protein
MIDEQYTFNLDKTNWSKVSKTVRASIKKAIFYIGLKVPYKITEELIIFQNESKDESSLKRYFKEFYDLFLIDAKIRYCDDIIDGVLSKQCPKPVDKIEKVIAGLENDLKENVGEVANLFKKELILLESDMDKETYKKNIKELIELRPCDYFLLVNGLIDKFGTELSKSDYENSLAFFHEFQRLRDLLDEMMSIEEDILKGDYNHIVLAKKHDISYEFFDLIVKEKIENLTKINERILDHPNKNIFYDTINFWKGEYETIFKPLLISYYINLEEFKKKYFMIKQL